MRRFVSPLSVAVLLCVVALLGLLGYGVVSEAPDRDIEQALAGGQREPAPKLRLPPLGGGRPISLSAFRGRVVVLNYWASWCEPCRQESPLLQRWHERIERRGGTVLGVDVLDVTEDAQAFVREYGLSYPMLRDPGGDTLKSFGVVAYPETFVLDRRGHIAASRRGPVDEAFLERTVPPLLRESQ